ncbi:hypothetical protein CSUI_001204 [Cystoisospora suis]|uniref:Uncharacterized protein n=1 Tax=Cystoisospora suis TaxID=483139 RepID=A0A2C6KYB0_9APIC|nr:hypothetical protein CSUI_001204 [Cystoisospora suis]
MYKSLYLFSAVFLSFTSLPLWSLSFSSVPLSSSVVCGRFIRTSSLISFSLSLPSTLPLLLSSFIFFSLQASLLQLHGPFSLLFLFLHSSSIDVSASLPAHVSYFFSLQLFSFLSFSGSFTMASVLFGGKFFQSLNKSLVQVLVKQLGTHILKYIHADFEKAAVGGLMDHVSLDHVSLNIHQINSDLILHQMPFQVSYGTIKKLEINLYLAHAQLHIIVTGLRIGITPHYSSSILFSLDNYFYDEAQHQHLSSSSSGRGRNGIGLSGGISSSSSDADPSFSSSSTTGLHHNSTNSNPHTLVPSSGYSSGISNFISSSLASSILGGGGGNNGSKGKGFFSGGGFIGSLGGSGTSTTSGGGGGSIDAGGGKESMLLLLPREVYDSQVGKIKSHVKTCENWLRRESLRKQIERIERLLHQLHHQLADRAPGSSTADALISAIERHQAEYRALQEQLKDSVLTDSDNNEFQPLLQWLIRYMPNIKIRIDDVRIDFEDLQDTVHPMRCGCKIARILLQPQPQGLWEINWPKRSDDEVSNNTSTTTNRTTASSAASRNHLHSAKSSGDNISSDVSVGISDGSRQGGSEDLPGFFSSDGSPRCSDTTSSFSATETPTSENSGASCSSSTTSSTRDLTYAISLEGFGIFWEDAASVLGGAASRAGVGPTSRSSTRTDVSSTTTSSRRVPPSSTSSAQPLSSSTIVRSPTELAEVLSSSSSRRAPPPRPAVHTSVAGGLGSRVSDVIRESSTDVSSSSSASRQQHRSDSREGGKNRSSSFSSSVHHADDDDDDVSSQGGDNSDTSPQLSPPSTTASTSPVFSEKIPTASFPRDAARRRRGGDNTLARSTFLFRRWLLRPCDVQLHCGIHSSSGLLPNSSTSCTTSYASSLTPLPPSSSKQMVTKFVLRLEKRVEVELDEGMMMGFAMIYKRLEHQKRLSLLRVYRPNVRPRCTHSWHPVLSVRSDGHGHDGESVSSSSTPSNAYTYYSREGRSGGAGEKESSFPYKESRGGEADYSYSSTPTSKGKSSCKQWWMYALQFVRLLRQQRPVPSLASSDIYTGATGDNRAGGGGAAAGGSRSNYWGQMEERTSHMKRYLRIAKRYLLGQRLERILYGPVIASSSSSSDFAKAPERGTSSPASLSAHQGTASTLFDTNQASTSSSSFFFGRRPARLSPSDLQDFFSHYWSEYQQQLSVARQQQQHKNLGRTSGLPMTSSSSGSAQGGRSGRAGGYYYLGGDVDNDDGAMIAGGNDSDAAFIVKETASRPYWAIAQWHMLAYEEVSRAESHLQQLPHIREQQKELRQSIFQLEQEQMTLLATRQKLLLTTRLHTPGRHESHPGDAKEIISHIQHQEQEQLQAVQRSQQKVQELLQPYHREILAWFESSPQFVRLSRRAVACLEAIKQHRTEQQEEAEDQPATTVEEYTRVTRLLKASACWRRSRDRMLCWAEFYRNYSRAFPLTECVLVDLAQLERVGRQQQDAVLSLAESSGLVVKRATRQTSTGAGGSGGSLSSVDSSFRQTGGGRGGRASVDGFTQSSSHQDRSFASVALPPVPDICRHLLESKPLPIPHIFRHVLFACVLRHVSISVTPRVSHPPHSSSTRNSSMASHGDNSRGNAPSSNSSSKYYSLQQRQADQQLQLQWIALDIRDFAFQLQTYEEVSITACLRLCELLHLRGSRTPSTTSSSSAATTVAASSSLLSKENVLIVTAGRLVERSKQVLLRLAYTSSAPASASRPLHLPPSEGAQGSGDSGSYCASTGSSPTSRSYSSSPRAAGGRGSPVSSRRPSTTNRLHPDQSLQVVSSLYQGGSPSAPVFPGSSPPNISGGSDGEKTADWGGEGGSNHRISLENDLFNDVILLHLKDEEEPVSSLSGFPGGGDGHHALGGKGGGTSGRSSALSCGPTGERSLTSRRSSGASSTYNSTAGTSSKSAGGGTEDRATGGSVDAGGGSMIGTGRFVLVDEHVKKALQRAVAKAKLMERTFSRKWVWGTVRVVSVSLLQNQLRLGVPLFLQVALYGQHLNVSASLQQLQVAYEDAWRLFTSFLYTTIACDRELGVRPRSIDSTDCLGFYSGLLSQYRAYNQEVAGAGRGSRGADSTQPSSTSSAVTTPQVPSVVSKGFKSFSPPAVDVQFLIDRVVSSVSSMPPPAGPAPSSGGAASPTLVPIPTDTPQSMSVTEASLLEPFLGTGSPNTAILETDPSYFSPLHPSASSPSLIQARRKAGISTGGLPHPPSYGEDLQDAGGEAGVRRAVFRRSSEDHSKIGGGGSFTVTPGGIENPKHSSSSSLVKFQQQTERENLLTSEWRKVAAALTYTCLHGKIQLPSVSVQLYDRPHFVPIQTSPSVNNPLGHPGKSTAVTVQGRSGDSRTAPCSQGNSSDQKRSSITGGSAPTTRLIFPSSTPNSRSGTGGSPYTIDRSYAPQKRDEDSTRNNSRSSGGELTSCIVSLTSIGGGVQAVPLACIPIVKPGSEVSSAPPICTLSIGSSLPLTFSLGETRNPDGSARLFIFSPPSLSVTTSCTLSLLSMVPVLIELVRDKLSLFRTLSSLFQPDCFDFTPFDLMRLLRSQIVISGCCKGVGGEERKSGDDSVAAVSRGFTLSSPVVGSGGGTSLSSSGDARFFSTVKAGSLTSRSREDSMASVFSDESNRTSCGSQSSGGSVGGSGSVGLRKLPSVGRSGKGHDEGNLVSSRTQQSMKEAWWLRILESSLAPHSQLFCADDIFGGGSSQGGGNGLLREGGREAGENNSSTLTRHKRSDSVEGNADEIFQGKYQGSLSPGERNSNAFLDRGEESRGGRSHLSLPVQQKHVDDDGGMSDSLWCPSGDDEGDDEGDEHNASVLDHAGPDATTQMLGASDLQTTMEQDSLRDPDEEKGGGGGVMEDSQQEDLPHDEAKPGGGVSELAHSQGDLIEESDETEGGLEHVDASLLNAASSVGDTLVLTNSNFLEEQQPGGDSVYSQLDSEVAPSAGAGNVHHDSPGDSVQISSVSSVVSEGAGVPSSMDSTSTRPPSSTATATEKAIENDEGRALENVVPFPGSNFSATTVPSAGGYREQPSAADATGEGETYQGLSGVHTPQNVVPLMTGSDAGRDSSVFLVAQSIPVCTPGTDANERSKGSVKHSDLAAATLSSYVTPSEGRGLPSFSAHAPSSGSPVVKKEPVTGCSGISIVACPDEEVASETSSKRESQRTSRRGSSGEEGGNRSDHSVSSGAASSHHLGTPFSSSSSSGARLGNLLSRMSRRKGGGRSRAPSPLAAAVEESSHSQQIPEEQHEVHEIRGVKGSGKRSHPFKLFNG